MRGGGWRRSSSSTGEVSEEGPDLLIHPSEISLHRWHTNIRHHGNRRRAAQTCRAGRFKSNNCLHKQAM